MKFKKYISIAVAAMMSLSSIAASAAVTQDGDGWYLADSVITSADITSRTPQVTVNVEKILATEAYTLGITKGKGASLKDDTTCDFYKVTYTIANLGELMWAYPNDDSYDESKAIQARLQIVTINVPGIENNKQVATSASFNGGSWTAGGNGFQWKQKDSDVANAYPIPATDSNGTVGAYLENGAMDPAVVTYAVEKNATLNATPTGYATYYIRYDGIEGGNNFDATMSFDKNVVFESAKTKYTVTFMNGEETVQSGEVEEGAVITAPADPVKAGYTFVGWYDGETKFEAGTTASKTVTYTAKFIKDPVSVTKITISGVAATMTVGDTGTATATVEPADADNKTVTWSSSAEDVLAINATTGAYEALKAGTAVITATAADGSSVTATVNVTVNAPAPAEQTITVGTPFKGTENKGFVWRVTVENFKNAGLSYKFTDEDTSEVRENDFNLGSHELSNFVFDVIMNTERANVKLEVK